MRASFDWGPELPTLAGPRVDLRGLTRQDVPAILGIFGDPAVMEFWSSPPLGDLAEATALLDEIHHLFDSRRLFQWGIRLRETD